MDTIFWPTDLLHLFLIMMDFLFIIIPFMIIIIIIVIIIISILIINYAAPGSNFSTDYKGGGQTIKTLVNYIIQVLPSQGSPINIPKKIINFKSIDWFLHLDLHTIVLMGLPVALMQVPGYYLKKFMVLVLGRWINYWIQDECDFIGHQIN